MNPIDARREARRSAAIELLRHEQLTHVEREEVLALIDRRDPPIEDLPIEVGVAIAVLQAYEELL